MVSTAFKADPWRSVSMFGLSAIGQFVMALSAFWLKLLTDGAVKSDHGLVVLAAVALGCSWGLSEFAVWVSWKIRVVLQERTSLLIDRKIVEITAGLPGIEHHESPEYANRLSLLRQQRDHIVLTIGIMANAVGLAVRSATTLVLLFTLHPALLLLPAFAIPSLWGGARSAAIQQAGIERTVERERKSKHLFKLATTAAPAKELRIFDLGDEIVSRHQHLWKQVDRERTRASLKGAAISAAAWSAFAIGYVGALILMAIRAVDGIAGVDEVVMALILAAQVRGQVGGAVTVTNSLMRVLKIVGNYLWLLDYAKQAEIGRDGAVAPTRISTGIRFEDVSFTYPGTDSEVLSRVDISLPAASTVAIVGDNGAGKTTLVKLLCRFYEPTRGRITVDGVDITSFDIESWRSSLSGAFQDFAKFEFEARRVVGVGDLPNLDDDSAVMAAMRQAGGADVVAALPRGLGTQLGRSFEGGVDVSVGQWQKLALGRAMMRNSPILLLLDEPTASLDAETEYNLFERYSGAARRLAITNGGITLLVSHRFSTVRMADLIVVIDKGRMVEAGSHEDLVRAGGLYASLYAMQARAYR